MTFEERQGRVVPIIVINVKRRYFDSIPELFQYDPSDPGKDVIQPHLIPLFINVGINEMQGRGSD